MRTYLLGVLLAVTLQHNFVLALNKGFFYSGPLIFSYGGVNEENCLIDGSNEPGCRLGTAMCGGLEDKRLWWNMTGEVTSTGQNGQWKGYFRGQVKNYFTGLCLSYTSMVAPEDPFEEMMPDPKEAEVGVISEACNMEADNQVIRWWTHEDMKPYTRITEIETDAMPECDSTMSMEAGGSIWPRSRQMLAKRGEPSLIQLGCSEQSYWRTAWRAGIWDLTGAMATRAMDESNRLSGKCKGPMYNITYEYTTTITTYTTMMEKPTSKPHKPTTTDMHMSMSTDMSMSDEMSMSTSMPMPGNMTATSHKSTSRNMTTTIHMPTSSTNVDEELPMPTDLPMPSDMTESEHTDATSTRVGYPPKLRRRFYH